MPLEIIQKIQVQMQDDFVMALQHTRVWMTTIKKLTKKRHWLLV